MGGGRRAAGGARTSVRAGSAGGAALPQTLHGRGAERPPAPSAAFPPMNASPPLAPSRSRRRKFSVPGSGARPPLWPFRTYADASPPHGRWSCAERASGMVELWVQHRVILGVTPGMVAWMWDNLQGSSVRRPLVQGLGFRVHGLREGGPGHACGCSGFRV